MLSFLYGFIGGKASYETARSCCCNCELTKQSKRVPGICFVLPNNSFFHSPMYSSKVLLIKFSGGLFFIKQNLRFWLVWASWTDYEFLVLFKTILIDKRQKMVLFCFINFDFCLKLQLWSGLNVHFVLCTDRDSTSQVLFTMTLPSLLCTA